MSMLWVVVSVVVVVVVIVVVDVVVLMYVVIECVLVVEYNPVVIVIVAPMRRIISPLPQTPLLTRLLWSLVFPQRLPALRFRCVLI